MHVQLKRLGLVTAFTLGVGIFASPALAAGAPQDRDHHEQRADDHPDYSHNSYYRTGNREGLQDHRRNTQRAEDAHRHHFKSDDDRKAHDYGYQQGWQGQNYRDHHDPH